MALNRCASAYTGYAKVPESLDLKVVVQVVAKEAREAGNETLEDFALALHATMEKRPLDKYLAYRKVGGVDFCFSARFLCFGSWLHGRHDCCTPKEGVSCL